MIRNTYYTTIVYSNLYSTSSFAIKKAGTTYELLIGIFYSGKSQHNFTTT